MCRLGLGVEDITATSLSRLVPGSPFIDGQSLKRVGSELAPDTHRKMRSERALDDPKLVRVRNSDISGPSS